MHLNTVNAIFVHRAASCSLVTEDCIRQFCVYRTDTEHWHYEWMQSQKCWPSKDIKYWQTGFKKSLQRIYNIQSAAVTHTNQVLLYIQFSYNNLINSQTPHYLPQYYYCFHRPWREILLR